MKRRMREECEHAVGTSYQAESTSRRTPRRFCLPFSRRYLQKYERSKVVCDKTFLSPPPLQKAFVAKRALSECDLREVSKYSSFPRLRSGVISLVNRRKNFRKRHSIQLQSSLRAPHSPFHTWRTTKAKIESTS